MQLHDRPTPAEKEVRRSRSCTPVQQVAETPPAAPPVTLSSSHC